MFELSLFPARDGDALVLEWGEEGSPRRMLIDCGREAGWPQIRTAFQDLPAGEAEFELLVVTHIDADHIAGVLKMLAESERPVRFREVWFNAYHHLVEGDWETFGPSQGEDLSDLLRTSPAIWNHGFEGKAVVIEQDDDLPVIERAGLRLTLLSPTRPKLATLAREWGRWLASEGLSRGRTIPERPDNAKLIPEGFEAFGARPNIEALAAAPTTEDTSAANGSSIAFIAEYEGKRILLAGDAHPSVMADSLERIPPEKRRLDLIKLSHHGSKANFSRRFFDLIECDHYAVSTNGSYHNHPDPEMIARLIKWNGRGTHLHFNYRSEETAIWDDAALQADYGYRTHYPDEGRSGHATIAI